jgi:hypothetical protein
VFYRSSKHEDGYRYSKAEHDYNSRISNMTSVSIHHPATIKIYQAGYTLLHKSTRQSKFKYCKGKKDFQKIDRYSLNRKVSY